MRHVEFLGVPGSGKSTLSRLLVSDPEEPAVVIALEDAVPVAIRRRGQDPMTRQIARLANSGSSRMWRRAWVRSTDRLRAFNRFFAAHPESIGAIAEGLRHRDGRVLRPDLVVAWLVDLVASYETVFAAGDMAGTVVIDEGFCQRAVALFATDRDVEDDRLIESYLRAVPRPDVVVVVEAPLDLCRRRLDERGWSERVAEAPVEVRDDLLVGAAAVVDRAASVMAERGATVVRVDGSGPPDVLPDGLVDVI